MVVNTTSNNVNQTNTTVPSSLKNTVSSNSASHVQPSVLAVNPSKGYDVHVPTTDVDNAVKNAQSVQVTTTTNSAVKQPDGTYKIQSQTSTQSAIKVTQSATQNKTVNAGQPAADAENQIKSDYQNQANNINKATDQAKQNVADYEKQVAAVNQQKQQAVDNYNATKQTVDKDNATLTNDANAAKNNGVNVTTTASKTVNTPQDATNDFNTNDNNIKKANAQQDTYNQQYQSALKQYNADQASAKSDNSALTDAINNAKSAGVNVVTDSNQTVKSVGALQSDYSSQEKALTDAISNYKNAQAKVTNDNADIDKKNAAAKSQYNSEMADYQNKLNQYNSDEAKYQAALKNQQNAQNQMQGKLNNSGINTADLKQELNWSHSPNATLSVQALNGANLDIEKINLSDCPWDKNYVGWDSTYEYVIKNKTNTSLNGPFAQATYSGNLDMDYEGKPISKVVVTYSDLNNNNGNLNLTNLDSGDPRHFTSGLMTPYIRIGNDPNDDLWYGNAQSVVEKYQFYDANGNLINFDNNAYITVGSLNAYNNHLEEAQLLSSGKAIALAGSNIGVYANNTLHSNGDQEDQSKWDKNSLTTGDAYYGAGVFQVTGNNVQIKLSVDRTYKSSQLGPQDTASMTKDNHPGIWALIGTTLPTTPSIGGITPPTPPTKPTEPSYIPHENTPEPPTVHVHYDTLQETPPTAQHASVSYNLDTPDSKSLQTPPKYPVYTPTNVDYHYDGLNVTPVVSKNVELGTVTGDNGKSVNGQSVVAGQAITFPLTSQVLPANRTTKTTSDVIVDKLDDNFNYTGYKAVLGTQDVSDWYDVKDDNNTLTITAKQPLLDAANKDMSNQFALPVIDIYGTVKNAASQVKNQYQEAINNVDYPSNMVTVMTPPPTQPVKTVDNNAGQDLNDQFVSQGQTLSYDISLPLQQYKGVNVDNVEAGKGLGWTDKLDSRLTFVPNSVVVTAKDNGKVVSVPSSALTVSEQNGQLSVAFKDPISAIANYGGDDLSMAFKATVNHDISGAIDNQAYNNVFGNEYPSNKVTVFVPNPHKDVEAGIVQGSGNTSIDGKDVVAGQTFTFPLTTTPLPAGRATVITSYKVVDKLDPNFKYDSYQSFKDGEEDTGLWTPKLTQNSDGTWTAEYDATQALLDQMNADRSKAFEVPTIDLYGSAKASNVTINNKYQEIINGGSSDGGSSTTSNNGGGTWTSNTVTVHTTPSEKPTKTVDNADGEDINNKNVLPGDAVNYNVTLDLDDLKNVVLTPDTIARGLGIIDQLPNGVTCNGIEVKTADGKDITNEFNIVKNGQNDSVMAKDPLSLVRTYGDTKLDVEFLTKVNDGFVGDLTNVATQNTFGNMVKTNMVVDHVQKINPKKDVCLNVGDETSLNNKILQFGHVYNYVLDVDRPANYGGVTKQMDIVDNLPKQADYTGLTEVYSKNPITLSDGTVLPTGTNITKYFTITYNPSTNQVRVSPTPEFDKIINSAANRKGSMGWRVFVQFKVNGYGKLVNTFEEIYNGDVVKSNTVTNNVPEPKKPATPVAKSTPSAPVTPAPKAPVAPSAPVTPAPKAPVAPSAPVTPAPKAPVASAPSTPAAPAPVVPAPEAAQPQGHWVRVAELPQTGEEDNNDTLLEAALALGTMGLVGSQLKRNKK